MLKGATSTPCYTEAFSGTPRSDLLKIGGQNISSRVFVFFLIPRWVELFSLQCLKLFHWGSLEHYIRIRMRPRWVSGKGVDWELLSANGYWVLILSQPWCEDTPHMYCFTCPSSHFWKETQTQGIWTKYIQVQPIHEMAWRQPFKLPSMRSNISLVSWVPSPKMPAALLSGPEGAPGLRRPESQMRHLPVILDRWFYSFEPQSPILQNGNSKESLSPFEGLLWELN